ncbi:Hypothetical_protein [Hexamita inflata]|uniref:Hypothetical_protein n=1 Tax=Hexamita inflata TaxID=28002 RepID=A0ABP1H0D1_9EUKA
MIFYELFKRARVSVKCLCGYYNIFDMKIVTETPSCNTDRLLYQHSYYRHIHSNRSIILRTTIYVLLTSFKLNVGKEQFKRYAGMYTISQQLVKIATHSIVPCIMILCNVMCLKHARFIINGVQGFVLG